MSFNASIGGKDHLMIFHFYVGFLAVGCWLKLRRIEEKALPFHRLFSNSSFFKAGTSAKSLV